MTLSPIEKLQSLCHDDLIEANALIRSRMRSENAPRIPEITNHLIGAGGKRLRPLLTIASANLVGYEGRHHILLAATVEFIHTATLLHDDVVDESEKRRGRPTANLLWDNQSSVLVGDYLFSRAFQLMVETDNLDVLAVLANASATISEGEILQLTAARNLKTTKETYLKIIRGKTAALFSAACEVSAIIAECCTSEREALARYGDAIGVAFQIVDDLLDYQSVSEKLGKNAGDDFREGKMTLPIIDAYEAASPNERVFWEEALTGKRNSESDFSKACALLSESGALSRTHEAAKREVENAKEALQMFPPNQFRGLLEALADYILLRAH